MKTKIDISKLSKKEWLEERRKGIGASDVGAIMGMNPFKSALEVWHDKVKGYQEEGENIPAEVGIVLEDYLIGKFREWYRETYKVETLVERPDYMVVAKDLPILRANLDGICEEPDGEWAVVECKTANVFARKLWGEGEMPDAYYIQVQAQLLATGFKKAYVPHLIGNNRFDVKIVERNEEVIKRIKEDVNKFWEMVKSETPPAPDGSMSAGKVLDLMFDEIDIGSMMEFCPFGEECDLLEEYDILNEEYKALRKEIGEIKQKLQFKMGNTEMAICGRHKITWKNQTRKAYSVEESTSRVFRIYSKKEVSNGKN